jgi:hypothetical protein
VIVDAQTHESMVGEAQAELSRFVVTAPSEAIARALVRRAERGARRTGRPVGDVFRELLDQEVTQREQELIRAREETARLQAGRRERQAQILDNLQRIAKLSQTSSGARVVVVAPRGIGVPDWQGGDVQVSRDGRGGR